MKCKYLRRRFIYFIILWSRRILESDGIGLIPENGHVSVCLIFNDFQILVIVNGYTLAFLMYIDYLSH